MQRSAVLFDLDGTLVATRALYFEAYRVAVEPYVRRDLSPEDIMALHPTSEVAFLRAVVAESDFDTCLERFYEAYGRLHATMFEGVFAGVPALLDRIRAARLPLGLVTGKSRRAWEITNAAARLGSFDVLVLDDDVRAPKPDPDGIQLAIRGTGAEPGRSFYVGDTMTDVRAALAAGVRPVIALWGRPDDERAAFAARVREAGATIAESPDDVAPIIGLAPGRADQGTPR